MELQTKLSTAARVLEKATATAMTKVTEAGQSLEKVKKASEVFNSIVAGAMEANIMEMVDSPEQEQDVEGAEEEQPAAVDEIDIEEGAERAPWHNNAWGAWSGKFGPETTPIRVPRSTPYECVFVGLNVPLLYLLVRL